MADPVYNQFPFAVGSLAATGQSDGSTNQPWFRPAKGSGGNGQFNLTIYGTWAGSFVVERRFDGDATWYPCTNAFATVAPTANGSEVLVEPSNRATYRINFTRTSGTLQYRFDQ